MCHRERMLCRVLEQLHSTHCSCSNFRSCTHKLCGSHILKQQMCHNHSSWAIIRILHLCNRSVTGACVARDDVSAPIGKSASSSSNSSSGKPAVVVRTPSGASATLRTAAVDKQKRPPQPSRGLEALQGPQVSYNTPLQQHYDSTVPVLLVSVLSYQQLLMLLQPWSEHADNC